MITGTMKQTIASMYSKIMVIHLGLGPKPLLMVMQQQIQQFAQP